MTADLPKGWEWSTLEDLAAVEPRSLTDGPFGSNLKSSHYVDEGPRVIRLQNIGFGEFVDEEAHITPEHFETLLTHEVRAGDLVVASLGQDLPRTCLIPAHVGEAIVKADCIRVRLHPGINSRYVNYALQRPALRQAVAEQIHGVGRPRLGMGGIRALPVPLPPREEQERIVAAIEEHLSRLGAAETALSAAVIRSDVLEGSVLRASFALPDQRPTAELSDLLVHTSGGVWGSEPGTDERDVRVLRVTEMNARGQLEPSTAAHPSISAAQLASRQLQVGDLLLEKSGGGPTRPVGRVGRVVQVDEPSVSSNFMQLMRPDPTVVHSAYLELALRSFHRSGGTEDLQTASTNIRNLKTKDYLRVRVSVPSLEVQKRALAEVETSLGGTERLRASARVGLRRVQALRRSILAAAFAGKLVPQDPSDEPASVLLERIRAEREAAGPRRRSRS